MDFEYTDEQRLLAETLRRFLATGYSFDARAKIMASQAGYSEDVWAALAEMGVLGVPFDAEHGGYGGSTVDMMIVMEALGEALVVEPYLATVGLGGRFVARGGTEAQRSAYPARADSGQDQARLRPDRAGRALRPPPGLDAGAAIRRWLGARRREGRRAPWRIRRPARGVRPHGGDATPIRTASASFSWSGRRPVSR